MEFIKAITYSETYPVRQAAMYRGQDRSFVMIDNDAEGTHYGLFYKEKLVSVVSLFETDRSIQFRKFATLPAFQNKGFGRVLLLFVVEKARSKYVTRLWCNARKEKEYFYAGFGFKTTGKNFIKHQIHYVEMEMLFKGVEK